MYLSALSQNAILLKGKVIDRNKAAVPFVNVYINNTSFVAQTDENGLFKLKVNREIPKMELVVSSVGYKTFKKSITAKEAQTNLEIVLETNSIGEVKITGKRDGEWRRKWRIFKDGILGQTMFTSDCNILNMNAVRLVYDDEKKVLGTATEPIIIQNDGLGYKVAFDMLQFTSDGSETYYGGDKYFEELKPKDEKQANKWKENRERAYKASSKSFLESLTEGLTKERGFEVFGVNNMQTYFVGKSSVRSEITFKNFTPLEAKDICFKDSVENFYYLFSKKTLLVFHLEHYSSRSPYLDYPYEFTIIELPSKYLTFTKNGWIKNYNGVLFKNFWGREGFSNLLPDDYKP